MLLHKTINRVNPMETASDTVDVFRAIDWSLANMGKMNVENWGPYAYKPESRFYLLYDDEHFYLLLLTSGEYEKSPRKEVSEFQGSVCQDSCLECFLSFNPDSPLYLNIESNALGTPHVGLGEQRKGRKHLTAEEVSDLKILPIKVGESSLNNLDFAYDWGLFIEIPLSFLAQFWPEIKLTDKDFKPLRPGQRIRANFYKCGDLTPVPHFYTWAPIETAQPDFHQPAFFGHLVLG